MPSAGGRFALGILGSPPLERCQLSGDASHYEIEIIAGAFARRISEDGRMRLLESPNASAPGER